MRVNSKHAARRVPNAGDAEHEPDVPAVGSIAGSAGPRQAAAGASIQAHSPSQTNVPITTTGYVT